MGVGLDKLLLGGKCVIEALRWSLDTLPSLTSSQISAVSEAVFTAASFMLDLGAVLPRGCARGLGGKTECF